MSYKYYLETHLINNEVIHTFVRLQHLLLYYQINSWINYKNLASVTSYFYVCFSTPIFTFIVVILELSRCYVIEISKVNRTQQETFKPLVLNWNEKSKDGTITKMHFSKLCHFISTRELSVTWFTVKTL